MAQANQTHNGKNRSHSLPSATLADLPIVGFDDRLMGIAENIAQLRTRTYDDIAGGQIHGDQTAKEAHLTGVMGELAVAKYLPWTNIHDVDAMHDRGDGGHDLEAGDVTIDVKATATNMRVPDLLVPENPHPTADRYILAHRYAPREVRLVGVVSRDVVLDHPVRPFPGTRRNYWIPAEDLSHFVAKQS